jgi:DNA-binding MarR family transcriptional regulator
LGRVYDSHISSAGINITQFAVLRCIARRAGEPLVRIAEEMEMDRTSLYRAIAPMLRDGWLADGQPVNPRFRTAKVTRKGRLVLAAATKRWNRLQRQVIGRFGQGAYDSLLSELHRLADCATTAE